MQSICVALMGSGAELTRRMVVEERVEKLKNGKDEVTGEMIKGG